MKSEEFVHLHLHSEYSLSDGIIRVEDLVNYSYENNFPAIALTDFSNLFGLIKFYRLARQKGIKPIVGCELNLTKEESNMGAPLILIVKNKEGYTNLTNIVSKSYIEGLQDGIPSVKVNWLKEYSEGLVALSGGQKGHIGQALLSRDLKLAKKRLDFFKEVFGDDFYIEVQRVGRADEEEYNQSAIKLAREEGVCLVATNDVRFLSPIDPDDEMPSDFEAHEARVCIQKGEVLADSSRAKEYSESQYLASSEEMRNKFSDIPEALELSLIHI